MAAGCSETVPPPARPAGTPGRLERELDEELRFHLEKEIEQQPGARDDARPRRASRPCSSFGGVEQTKEQLRDHRGLGLAGRAGQGPALRPAHAAQGARASPPVAVLSLALGIGANTALFSVAESLLLRPCRWSQPERLVLFEWEAGTAFRNSGISGWSHDDRDQAPAGQLVVSPPHL